MDDCPTGFGTAQSLPRREEMVPLGGIIQWSGAIVDIPTGWQLCDGTNGTPDLRDKFVAGAGSTYAVDETGGALTHNHPFTGDGHTHEATDTHVLTPSGVITVFGGTFTQSSDAAGITDSSGSLPPFLALAFIQRMV